MENITYLRNIQTFGVMRCDYKAKTWKVKVFSVMLSASRSRSKKLSILLLLTMSLFVINLFSVSDAHASEAPSFNCKRASTEVEKVICSDSSLALKDRKLAKLYRQFKNSLPEADRKDARQMQRLWLKNRDIRCENKKKYFLAGLLSDEDKKSQHWYYVTDISQPEKHSIELPALSDESILSCVGKYYDQAINSLQKGALSVDIYIVSGIRHYPISVQDIKSLDIEEQGNRYEYQLWLNAGKNHSLLGDYGSSYGSGSTVLALRLFMLKGGVFASALQEYVFSKGGGHCGVGESLGLKFFDTKDGKSYIHSGHSPSFGDNQQGVPIYDAVHSCYPYENRAIDWNTDAGRLVFLYRTKQENLWSSEWLPSLVSYFVDPEVATINAKPYVETNKDSFRGQSYAGMWKEFSTSHAAPKGNDGLDCRSVTALISSYSSLARFAGTKDLTVQQVTYFLDNIWKPGKFDEAVAQFAPLSKIFLAYLERTRSIDNWQEKMKQAISQNQRALQDDPYTRHYGFISNAGFPTEGGCMVSTRSDAAGLSLEDWFYQFWYRRENAGNLNQTEAWLRRFSMP